jgi:hypothetical protein
MSQRRSVPNGVTKASDFHPGTTAEHGPDVAPYTIPYTGSIAIPTDEGYLPASISGHPRFPGFTPNNTPEPDARMPMRLNRHYGNLTDGEITERINSLDIAAGSDDARNERIMDKLNSCRRDWQFILDSQARIIADQVNSTATIDEDVTSFIEANHNLMWLNKSDAIEAVLKKEKNVLPAGVYAMLKPRFEWDNVS